MPDDYLHLLNCICLFDVNKKKECWNPGDVMVVGATKLTADSWSSVVDDVYNQPTKKRPYYYVHNQNDISVTEGILDDDNSNLPSNEATDALHTMQHVLDSLPTDIVTAITAAGAKSEGTRATVIAEAKDAAKNDPAALQAIIECEVTIASDATASATATALSQIKYYQPSGNSNFARTFAFDESSKDAIEKPAGSRHANSSRVKVEIRCGRDKSNIFSLSAVQIDYVKAP
jgi:hypothetical protein